MFHGTTRNMPLLSCCLIIYWCIVNKGPPTGGINHKSGTSGFTNRKKYRGQPGVKEKIGDEKEERRSGDFRDQEEKSIVSKVTVVHWAVESNSPV